MKGFADLHLHSIHSCDAKSTIDEMCQSAIERGLEAICFTEHVDWNANDEGLDYYRYDEHTRDIQLAQDKYCGQIIVLKGIEFSEPHRYPKEFEILMEKDFDFVLGSVHYLGNTWVGDKRILTDSTLEQVYERYYREVLKAVQFGGFDSLAHIDVPKRYLGAKLEPVSLLEEILGELVKRRIALEINSSAIRRELTELHPSDAIFSLYEKCRGSWITTGSDAHSLERIGEHFSLISEKIAEFELQPVYFMKRQAIKIERS